MNCTNHQCMANLHASKTAHKLSGINYLTCTQSFSCTVCPLRSENILLFLIVSDAPFVTSRKIYYYNLWSFIYMINALALNCTNLLKKYFSSICLHKSTFTNYYYRQNVFDKILNRFLSKITYIVNNV